MIVFLLVFMSLCPKMGTGTFYFSERLIQEEGKDSFYGVIQVKESSIDVETFYPDTQRYRVKGDSIYMFGEQDTMVIYRKGIFSTIMELISDGKYRRIPLDEGCIILPTDSLLPDSVYVFGKKYIDSVKVVKQNSLEVFVKFWRGQN